jgi:hypothetical protein
MAVIIMTFSISAESVTLMLDVANNAFKASVVMLIVVVPLIKILVIGVSLKNER